MITCCSCVYMMIVTKTWLRKDEKNMVRTLSIFVNAFGPVDTFIKEEVNSVKSLVVVTIN